MALVSVVMVGLAMFSDVGISAAVIQHRRGVETSFLNTVWTIQIIRGFALWAAACLLAWPASLLYQQPMLFPLLCVVGATAAINGFQTTAIAKANRDIRLARLTVVKLCGQAVSICATMVLAWKFESVWALAVGNVIGAAIQTAMGYCLSSIARPSSLFGQGRASFASRIWKMDFPGNNGDICRGAGPPGTSGRPRSDRRARKDLYCVDVSTSLERYGRTAPLRGSIPGAIEGCA